MTWIKNDEIIFSECDLGCPKIFNPVCGGDDTRSDSYGNQCYLDQQNCLIGRNALKKLHNGPCEGKNLYLHVFRWKIEFEILEMIDKICLC